MVSWEGAGDPYVIHWLCDLSANERKQASSDYASLRQDAGIKEEWGKNEVAKKEKMYKHEIRIYWLRSLYPCLIFLEKENAWQ